MRARFAVIGVDAIKVRVYDRLALTRLPDGQYPPGYMHFSESCNKDFFDQLTSEKRVIVKDQSGYPRMKWKLPEGRRNEVLDCFVGNVAAITLLNPDFAKLKEKLDAKVAAAKAQPEASGQPEPPPEKPKPPTKRRRSQWQIKI